jgi:hypothetical protein
MRRQATTTAARPKPTMAEVAPDWWALTQRLLELTAERDAKIARGQELARKVDPAALVYERTAAPPKPRKLTERAARLLGNLAPAPEPPPEVRAPNPLVPEIRETNREIAAIDEAIREIHAQLPRAHAEGSRKLCELWREDYHAVARRLCAAAVELGVAMLAHRQLTDELARQGASWAFFPPVDIGTLFDRLGDPADPHSPLRSFLARAAEVGQHDPASIPPDWR